MLKLSGWPRLTWGRGPKPAAASVAPVGDEPRRRACVRRRGRQQAPLPPRVARPPRFTVLLGQPRSLAREAIIRPRPPLGGGASDGLG